MNILKATHKELRPTFQKVLQQGGKIEHTKSGHFKIFPLDKTKPIIYASGTPSSGGNAIENIKAKIKRVGFLI